jgi:hypothetical protein
MKFDIEEPYDKLSRHVYFHLNRTSLMKSLHEELRFFCKISLNINRRENVSNESCREDETICFLKSGDFQGKLSGILFAHFRTLILNKQP